MAKINFTENLSGRKILEFPHCKLATLIIQLFSSFQFRKNGQIKGQDQGDAGDVNRDEYNWPLCTNGESHKIQKLLLAQVIPKNELLELAHKVHHLRNQLGLNQFCHQLEDFAEAYSLQKISSESKVTPVSIFQHSWYAASACLFDFLPCSKFTPSLENIS